MRRLFVGHSKIGCLAIGRDDYRYLDASIQLELWPRPVVKDAERLFRLSVGVSWNWLPPYRWVSTDPCCSIKPCIDSIAWTGRDVTLAIDWRRWWRTAWVSWCP